MDRNSDGEYRRRAAVLATYLAQFEVASDRAEARGLYAHLSADDIEQRGRDCHDAEKWSCTMSFTEEDIQALATTRSRYGFPVA